MTKAKAFDALHYCKRNAMMKENIEFQIIAEDEYKSHP